MDTFRNVGTMACIGSRNGSRRERKRATDVGRCAEAESLDQPLLAIGLLEGAQGLLRVLDIGDVLHPEQFICPPGPKRWAMLPRALTFLLGRDE